MTENDFLPDIVRSYSDKLGRFLGQCESPIERTMLTALMWHFWIPPAFTFGPVSAGEGGKKAGVVEGQQRTGIEYGKVAIFPQLEVRFGQRRFRLDIAIRHRLAEGGETLIAVECDGHEFHEKTKEQASRDKARDRTLQAHGWVVMRFTGSDVWRNADNHAAEVMDVIKRRMDESKARA